MNETQITAAARKALIAADVQYFSWPASQQEMFRARAPRAAKKRIDQVLLASLLGIKCSLEEAEQIWDDLPIPQLNLLNAAKLMTTGIGEDYIFLNEGLPEGKTLLDYATLYDYDHEDYLFQEEVNRKEFPAYSGSDYFALRHPIWVRLLIKGKFHYASFFSLARHLCDDIEASGHDVIDQLIPHRYVEGEHHGKPQDGGFLWDQRLDANGLEGQLDELKSRWYSYLEARWVALSKDFQDLAPAVYSKAAEWDTDPNRYFIFNNATCLKHLHLRHFLADCELLMCETSSLEPLLKQEADRAKSWLTENHQDIMRNFDPKVAKLRKKRKIIMSPAALENQNRIGDDDETNDY